MATVTKLQIFNNALGHVGERDITQNELDTLARESVRRLESVWQEDVVLICLEMALWTFATRTVQLFPDNNVANAFGYRNSYEKPVDYVETNGISADPYFYTPLDRFKDEGGFWYTDANPLYVAYISSDPDWGRNTAIWPVSFWHLIAAYMAWRVAPRLAQSEAKTKELKDLQEELKMTAQGKDALKRPTTYLPQGSWTRARTGYRGRRDRETSGY